MSEAGGQRHQSPVIASKFENLLNMGGLSCLFHWNLIANISPVFLYIVEPELVNRLVITFGTEFARVQESAIMTLYVVEKNMFSRSSASSLCS